MTTPLPSAEGPVAGPRCYRHPERETYIACTRCSRPICPDCMTDASVGFHCPECVRAGAATQRSARSVFGGAAPTGQAGTVTRTIIALCIGVFLLQQVPELRIERRFWTSGLDIASGDYYRLLTAAFLHGGLLHILFNMYALFVLGPQLEALFGTTRFLTVYVVSAVGGSVTSYVFSAPLVASVGASGAIFGLLGAYLVVNRHLGRDSSGLLGLLLINALIGFVVPNIDWRAHVGGFVTGALVAAALVYAPKARRTPVQAAGVAAVALVLVALVAYRTSAVHDLYPVVFG